ncbi:hypothetical protein B0H16DRAFT_1756747 [Mycena metata]|uniref:Uncharacterized protein n=1 Tax=Mycena metata TaxID=1033252 RepID=A0AAD7K008_9AGAR|nr:hypothetical protein B0H16DRAFT_1756747 [Mycena metata]
MLTPLTPAQARLNNIKTSSTIVLDTLELLANASDLPFLKPITVTARSLLNLVQMMEQVYEIIQGIIRLHIQSDTGQLSPNLLTHIAEFTKTLYKVHTFVQAQEETNKFKQILRRGEMNALLRDCTSELQQVLSTFTLQGVDFLINARQMHEYENHVHQEVLRLINSWFNEESSDGASIIPQLSQVFSADHSRYTFSHSQDSVHPSYTLPSSNSLSLLPSEPKIFHGRESEVSDILKALRQGTPRIAILGPGDNLETLWEQVQFHGAIEEFLSLLAEVEHLALLVTMRGAFAPLVQHAARQTFEAVADDTHDAEDVEKVLLLTGNHWSLIWCLIWLPRMVAAMFCPDGRRQQP